MQKIGEGLYQLQAGPFVNAYLVEDLEGLTLVDAGPIYAAQALVDEIKASGHRPERLHQLILTHAHPEQAGGAAFLVRNHPMKVFAHPDDIPAIQGKEPLPRHPWHWQGFASLFQLAGSRYEPVDVISPIKPGQAPRSLARWQVLHTPGHTRGSLSLYEPTRAVLLCGDAVTHRRDGLVVEPFKGIEDEAARSLSRLSCLACNLLAPGHGPVVTSNVSRRLRELAACYGST